MGPLTRIGERLTFLNLLAVVCASTAFAQNTAVFCTASAVPAIVRANGIADKAGDILISCTGGSAGQNVSGNLTISLPVNITNKLIGSNIDAVLSLDTGSGPQQLPVFGQLLRSNQVAFNGINFTMLGSKGFNLRVSNLRIAAAQSGTQQIQANLAFNGLTQLSIQSSTVTVAVPSPGLLATYASNGIRCAGSPLPSTLDFPSLIAAGTLFASTRVTKGFATSFVTRAVDGGDNGTRFIVSYAGFPAGARVFVPNLVSGADAVTPTVAGDLGGTPSAGAYTPSATGSLLLARVNGADANGAGGTPVYQPTPSSGIVLLNSIGEVTLTSGSGYVVYEVVDSNPSIIESAQFPTFIAIPGSAVTANAVATEDVSLAPISNVFIASATDPVPRFVKTAPGNDCTAAGDCGAAFRPQLAVYAQPIQFSAFQGGTAFEYPGYIAVQNTGGGIMPWTATITYQNGTDWLTLDRNSGINNGSVRVFATPQKLGPGTYKATVTIDAGAGGTYPIPVLLLVTAFPPNPAPNPNPNPSPTPTPAPTVVINSISNGASFAGGPFAPGSIVTIKGTSFAGKSIGISFDGAPGVVLFSNDQQINVQVPASLTGKSANVVVTVDGSSSAAFRVDLAPLSPGIFANGVLNQDNTVNGPTNPAVTGTVIQIFATGLPALSGSTYVKIHDRDNLVPSYSGNAPGLNGVQQVNVTVPKDLPTMTTEVVVCGIDQNGTKYCSLPAKLTLVNNQ